MDENILREPFDMEDVPIEIWDSVYEKWNQACIDGWDKDKLWHGCDLCKWAKLSGLGCAQCPLVRGSWCNNFGAGSKLSIEYLDWTKNEDTWRLRIKDFLIYLEPYCTEDINYGYI